MNEKDDKPRNHETAVAIYDDKCGLCRNFAAMLRKLTSPHELDVVPCGSAIQKKLTSVSKEICSKSFTFVEPDGTVLSGEAAAARAITMAPGLEKFRWMIKTRAGKTAAKAVYRGAQWIRRKRKCCD